ncbi:hypothetical protein [Ferruginibacter sp. HRS2-29]|uniref:hypothetical protein n=1 Tax=Ferruginibacter sp. HRS2-29 TaxID=2487334 RepID=UPI0020CDAC7E|nr:hypothetical protein [Ferruginibacter sp. HRS2-29]
MSAASGVAQNKVSSKYVKLDDKGSLQYIPDSLGNILPDFSRVGCYANQEALPDIQTWRTIFPTGENSQQAIQSAIDELSVQPVGKDGFRGAILLKKGVYKIAGTIRITASGIVLRGEGDETKLVAAGKGQRSLISVAGTGQLQEISGTRRKIKESYVPLGTTSLTLQNVKGLKVGDSIVVFRPGTRQWIDDLKMNQIEVRDSNTRQWQPADYDLHFERVIIAINGSKITLDNPVVMAMEDKYGGGEIYRYTYKGRINNTGIEDLLCESEFNGDKDEDHGWDAVHFNKVQNGWVKNVTSVYFGYSCVNLGTEARNITVDSCKSLDAKSKIEGGRRYSFNNDGQMNLFMNCFASEGRHDYVTGAKVRGPNVFFNCKAEKTHADIGPHHRWAMGTLYDNIVSDGEINAQDRGNWGTGHGWSGVNQVFWNCTASKAAIQDPWVSGKNYVVALHAQNYSGRLKGRNSSYSDPGEADKLQISSLYLFQVREAAKQQIKNNPDQLNRTLRY